MYLYQRTNKPDSAYGLSNITILKFSNSETCWGYKNSVTSIRNKVIGILII